MKTLLYLIAFALISPLHAQDHGQAFLYGKVTLNSGKSYTGQLRWDKEEAFWTDMFHASKTKNEHIERLKQSEPLERTYHYRSNRFRNNSTGIHFKEDNNNRLSIRNGRVYKNDRPMFSYSTHQFTCQFGELESINKRQGSRPVLTFKDGSKMSISGNGYNDLSPTIRVYSKWDDNYHIKWNDVAKVEFFPAPYRFESKIGQALYGKVNSKAGAYEGYIIWDKDERVSSDKLDGDWNRKEMSIYFRDIRFIEKSGNGSEVVLKDRRSYHLYGSNDVNQSNRGVVVVTPGLGRIEVDWDDFIDVTFYDQARVTMLSYDEFNAPTKIIGEVWLDNGEKLIGEITYDLDESYTYEILDGNIASSTMEIPFDAIRSIQPNGSEQSIVRLKSGRELMLKGSQDVTAKNTGILVTETSGRSLTFVKWGEVDKIIFY